MAKWKGFVTAKSSIENLKCQQQAMELGWFTHEHLRQYACTQFGRMYVTPLLKVIPPTNQKPCKRTVIVGRLTIGFRHFVLRIGMNTLMVTDWRPAQADKPENSHSSLIERTHSALKNKGFSDLEDRDMTGGLGRNSQFYIGNSH